MKIITDAEIRALGISPAQCMEWVREAFAIKSRAVLPPKVPVHPQGDDFITTMPCLLPPEYCRFGVKVVSRKRGRTPSLRSGLTLYDTESGEALALMDADWITDMRTGATAAVAIKALRRRGAKVYAFMGLGRIGRATLQCLAAATEGEKPVIRLLRYKDQAERLMRDFADVAGLRFELADTPEQLACGADVLVSAITAADGLILPDESVLAPGSLLVPVHTRGFQNCDLTFDKVVGDDYDHIKGFRYFDRFKAFCELAPVLSGSLPGRETPDQRIIAYNYGIALLDVYFATRIYALIT